MNYTREQIIEIIKYHSPKLDGDKMISNWQNRESNELLDLSEYAYPLFCYTFPILVDDVLIAEITLFRINSTGVDYEKDLLMNKYLSTEKYEASWVAFSHDTYLHCYLSIFSNLTIPKSDFLDTFYCYDGTFKDINGEIVKYKISYGDYDYDETDSITREKYFKYSREDYMYNVYHFLDCGVTLMIEKKDFDGNSLGEEINKRINDRRKNC